MAIPLEENVSPLSSNTPADLVREAPAAVGRLRILLVDDEPEILELFGAILRRRGWEVVSVASAIEGLGALAQDSFNLILMDVQMPQVSGLEAARVIRLRERREERPYTPIVALTAWARPEFRSACIAAGMDDFLTKPIDMAALWSAVERNAKTGPCQ